MKAKSLLYNYTILLNWENERASGQFNFLKSNLRFPTYFGKSPHIDSSHLTLPILYISENCIAIKININFYFHTFLWCASKGFIEALKAFIKPLEAPQRSVNIKISVDFFFLSGIGTGRVKQKKLQLVLRTKKSFP